jgi:polysaccharide biosynthesis transport protein
MENNMQEQSESLHFLDYWRVIRSRKEIILAVTLLVVLTGTAYTFTLPKIYQAQARMLVEDDALDVDVFQSTGGYSRYDPYFLRTQYELIKSKPIMYKVVDNLNLRQEWGEKLNEDGSPIPREVALNMLRNSVDVQQYRDTSIIALIVKRPDDNSEEASRIANEIAAVYRDHRLSVKRQMTQRGLEALRNELEKQKERVNEAEAEVEDLRERLGIAMIGENYRADNIRLQRLEGDRINARVDMLTRKARLEELEGLEGEVLISASEYIVNDQTLSSMRSQYLNAQVDLRVMQEEFGPEHPEIKRRMAALKELEAKIEDALDGMLSGLRTDYKVAQTRYETLAAELESARTIDIEAERTNLPFNKAQRELEIQRSILNALQARVVQEGIQLEVPRTPVELVDPAESSPGDRPVSPNLFLNIFLSLVLGLGSGVGLAYFIEYLDTSVKTVSDVERYLGLPVIGVIPQKVKPLVDEGPDSPHAESYRVLRTNMQFANKGHAGGAFAVVSGGVGEGKSTTLNNLAYVLAQMGDKVLIVDSDLRRPVQHSILGVSNRFGLTNLLMRDVPIEETIKPTSVPNLHLLPSGRLPRSSLGILDSQRVRELVKSLKARYDYVLFDTPPIMGISDASIITGETDGCLLVVQYRKYPRVVSTRARQMIENVGGRIIGVILNNINVMRDDYYYYYHSYYSHYYNAPEDNRADSLADSDEKI